MPAVSGAKSQHPACAVPALPQILHAGLGQAVPSKTTRFYSCSALSVNGKRETERQSVSHLLYKMTFLTSESELARNQPCTMQSAMPYTTRHMHATVMHRVVVHPRAHLLLEGQA
jgi:hypothetical protein